MKGRVVDKVIKELKAPRQGNRIRWDSEIPGFGVRITAANAISFVLDYRFAGRQRRYTIGRYPELTATAARIKAGQLRVRIQEGHDPLEERIQSRSEPTLNDLADEYLKTHADLKKRPASVRNDRHMLVTIIRPKLGKIRLKAVGRRDIEALHSSLKRTPYQANRVRSLLSKMFNLAVEWKWVAENPVRGIQKFDEKRRECWLSLEQLQRFREALDRYGSGESENKKQEERNAEKRNAADALKLLLLTGSRKGEVLKATWEQFDLDRGVWTKPSHHTKQNRTEHVPLSQAALDLLFRMRPPELTGPLFPGRRSGVRVSLTRPWVQACKGADLVVEKEVPGKKGTLKRYQPTVRIHDLRHSFASHLVNRGVTLQVVGKLLGHTQAATTMRYAHLQNETLREASNIFGSLYANSEKAR